MPDDGDSPKAVVVPALPAGTELTQPVPSGGPTPAAGSTSGEQRGTSLAFVVDRPEAERLLRNLAAKVESGSIDFDDVVECHYGAHPPLMDPDDEIEKPTPEQLKQQAAYLFLLPDVWDAFKKKYRVGKGNKADIAEQFWCQRVGSAAILIKESRPAEGPAKASDYEWHIRYNLDWDSEDSQVVRELDRCANLDIKADRLSGIQRGTAKQLIFEGYSSALDALDKRREHGGALTSDEIAALKAHVDDAAKFYEDSARAQASATYFAGAVWGVAFVLVLYDVLSSFGPPDLLGPMTPLVLSYGGGAAGAIVSVIQRMTSEDGLVKNFLVSNLVIRMFGMLRPILGCFIGTIFHVLVVSGLVPLALPKDPLILPYFFVGIAFLAGFSERWAKDILAKAPAGIGDSSAGAQSADASANRASS